MSKSKSFFSSPSLSKVEEVDQETLFTELELQKIIREAVLLSHGGLDVKVEIIKLRINSAVSSLREFSSKNEEQRISVKDLVKFITDGNHQIREGLICWLNEKYHPTHEEENLSLKIKIVKDAISDVKKSGSLGFEAAKIIASSPAKKGSMNLSEYSSPSVDNLQSPQPSVGTPEGSVLGAAKSRTPRTPLQFV